MIKFSKRFFRITSAFSYFPSSVPIREYTEQQTAFWPEAATRGVLWKKVFLEISQNSQENTCARVSCLTKLQRLWHRCFPVNFAKFLRTRLLQKTSGRLLLSDWQFLLRDTLGNAILIPEICYDMKNRLSWLKKH